MTDVAENRRTGLYRLIDGDGRLRYVGIGYDPLVRWNYHAATTDWWPEIAHTSVEWFPTRELAEAAETEAIAREKPMHNVVGSKSPPVKPKKDARLSFTDTPERLTTEEVAEVLGVKLASVYKMSQRNDFPSAEYIGRTPSWKRDEILDWRRAHPSRQRVS